MSSQPAVPLAALVAAFPVIERPPFVWVWLGEPLAARLRQPPTVNWQSNARWVASADVSRVEANFVLLHEHYLDLTHMFVVHPEAIPPGISELPPMDGVEVSETTVAYSRQLPSAPLAEWERRATRLASDRLYRRSEEGLFASPALHVGRYTIEGDDGSSYDHLRIQGFTPETATSTHVFLQVARNYDLDRAPLTHYLHSMFTRLALRDREIVEVIQSHRANAPLGGWPNVNVTADRAATRTRKIIRNMVADEAGRSSASLPSTSR
jgi:phenylpropionate dioxygenase-like ring-hydroxylating dioxygenase large terminal subunit